MFDSHFHLLPEEIHKNASFYNESWGGLEGHIKKMDEAGVGRALVSNPSTDYHIKKGVPEIQAARDYNIAVKALVGASGGRLRFLAAVPLTEPGEMLTEAQRASADGAVGLTMPTNGGGAYPDDARFIPFFEGIERMGLPVFFHPTTMTPFGHGELRHPLITPVFQYAFDTALCLAKVVESGLPQKLPRLKLAFASLGGVMPILAGRFDRTYRMLSGRGIVKDMGEEPGRTLKKVYVDTGGTDSAAALSLALEVFGEGRLLWGSDFPANRDFNSTVEAVKALNINSAAKEKILGRNLEQLIAKGNTL